MGARLVARAITYALPAPSTLSPAARTVLLVMCHTAKDGDRNPVYFAGSAYLARALGYPIAEDPDGRELASKAGRRAVARALKELVDVGYLDQVEGLARTWKRRWLITLPGLALVHAGDGDEVTRASPHEVTRMSSLR